jgi:hypothetical protein
MVKTTFTAEELANAIDEVQKINDNFPELPIKLPLGYYDFWSQDSFPMTFKQVGNDKNVTVFIKEYFDGEEGGDHEMRCVLQVGHGNDARYFLKTGLYNSWDTSEWDGPLTEVVAQEVKRTEWVTKK